MTRRKQNTQKPRTQGWTRRQVLATAGASSAAVALGAVGCARRREQPDVVFLAIDDLNDWASCLGGHPQAQTPNLDRVAARGTLFTNAHCCAPLCGGSRTALLLGLAPTTTGIYTNHVHFRDVLPDAVTLQQRFRDAGYRAVGTGKIYHLDDRQSWDDYFHAKLIEPRPQPDTGYGVGRDDLFDWGPLEEDDNSLGDGRTSAWAAERLRSEPSDRPLFLGAGLFRPHLPWYVPRKYFERYPPDAVVLPPYNPTDTDDLPPRARQMIRTRDFRAVQQADQWSHAVASYLASIAYSDTMLGRVVEALEERERRHGRPTVVVLWSDHGWHLGEKGHWRKFTLWERSTHVPLAISAPDLGTAGARCAAAVSLVDIYPTLLEICGLPSIAGLDGTSLVPLLHDTQRTLERPALTSMGPAANAVRNERWRLISYQEDQHELYDHESDPNEWENLAGRPELEAVERELAAWIPTDPAPRAPDRW